MSVKIAASILNADANQLEEEIKSVSESADWIHVDIMDNHFVPNLSFGISVLESLATKKVKPLDAHLMIENPDLWAPKFVEAGGLLFYAINTMNHKEGKALIEEFLHQHPDFKLLTQQQYLPYDTLNTALYYAALRKQK
jgi:ribulose-phosphate 3-epimerase